jgi:diketogulonate reductase-like aldo/keto reductase
MKTIPLIKLPSGQLVPRLGQGTWKFGQDIRRRAAEIDALRFGLDLGMTLIDTAERYSNGEAEKIVGEAIAGRRDEVFVVSKVSPENATRSGIIAACERSLRRLGTDRLDLYLLHWREEKPLEEAVDAFTHLIDRGSICSWGVSNFDVEELEELLGLTSQRMVATNQVMYNLRRRGIEFSLIPWCRQRCIPLMAYSPLDEGSLVGSEALTRVAERKGASPAQIAIAWILRQKSIIAIPRSGNPLHVNDNRAALEVDLSIDDMGVLDQAFPSPAERVTLQRVVPRSGRSGSG